MPVVLAVALGGAVGAVVRYGADSALSTHSTFPWSTFVVNVVGCFLIGWFSESFADSAEWLRTGMIVGLVGGFGCMRRLPYPRRQSSRRPMMIASHSSPERRR